jgi:hypothetical protein
MLNARDIRALLHNPEFQSIPDRNSQIVFLPEFALEKCFAHINDKTIATIYQKTESKVRKLFCRSRKHAANPDVNGDRSPALTDAQKEENV